MNDFEPHGLFFSVAVLTIVIGTTAVLSQAQSRADLGKKYERLSVYLVRAGILMFVANRPDMKLKLVIDFRDAVIRWVWTTLLDALIQPFPPPQIP